MMMKKRYGESLLAVALCFLVVLFQGVSRGADGDHDVEKFFGKYVGRSISVQGEGLSDRDFDVTISAYEEDGFTLDWKTVIRYTSGKTKHRSFSVNFLPFRKRAGIFFSAMAKNMFGKWVPADPLSGEPYVWAGVEKGTLTVTALHIVDDGGYELQVFKRTLTSSGMDTHFERVRNGEKMRIIIGKLDRVAN